MCMLLLAVFCQTPAPPIGVRTLDLIDDARGDRLLVTEVWYPAAADGSGSEPRPFATGVASAARRDSTVAAGRHPVVLFSHGLRSVREQSVFLVETLAAAGCVVVAPEHLYNSGRSYRPEQVYRAAIDRPLDVSRVLTEMLDRSAAAAGPFAGRLDAERIAAIGHSYGGYTALAVAGARPTSRYLAPAQRPDPQTLDYDFTDDRIGAAIALAPVTYPPFADDGFAHVRVPVLIVAGTQDVLTPLALHQRRPFDLLPGRKALAVFEGASHLDFADAGLFADAPPWFRFLHQSSVRRPQFEDGLRLAVLAFLEDALDLPGDYPPLPTLAIPHAQWILQGSTGTLPSGR